jgi:hypothetical protein
MLGLVLRKKFGRKRETKTGESFIITIFMICVFTKYHPWDKIKKVMGGACGTQGQKKKTYKVSVEKKKKKKGKETSAWI